MPPKRELSEELESYLEDLRTRVRAWMESHAPPMKQKQLAEILGIEQGTVSNNLGRACPMSEKFVSLIQQKLPEHFPGALDGYLELKHADSPPPRSSNEYWPRLNASSA